MEIVLKHAEMAVMCQNGCNPCGIMNDCHKMALEVLHESQSTDAVNSYPPYRLMLAKLADLAHLPTSFDQFEKDYLKCKDVVDAAC